jgi:hypothetical protein
VSCNQGLPLAGFGDPLSAPLGILGCRDLGAHPTVSHRDAETETDTEDGEGLSLN